MKRKDYFFTRERIMCYITFHYLGISVCWGDMLGDRYTQILVIILVDHWSRGSGTDWSTMYRNNESD